MSPLINYPLAGIALDFDIIKSLECEKPRKKNTHGLFLPSDAESRSD